jgi:glutathione S-transferase
MMEHCMPRHTVYHIPVCPFSQRLEILLSLKGKRHEIDFEVVDITRPRDARLLAKTRGSTALPVLETPDGGILKESLVILQYLEDLFPEPRLSQRDPYRHAVEAMLTGMENTFGNKGYGLVMNQDLGRRESLLQGMLEQYASLDDFLVQHSPERSFLFEEFGWAEVVFTPFFMRFWFLEYYEDFDLPDEPRFARVRKWREACWTSPHAQQVSREEIVKLYYDYAKGAGNGVLLPGRSRSSFVFEPHWRDRPWPPKDKYGHSATDAELGI